MAINYVFHRQGRLSAMNGELNLNHPKNRS